MASADSSQREAVTRGAGRSKLRSWLRALRSSDRQAQHARQGHSTHSTKGLSKASRNVHRALKTLPTLLDAGDIPNGVVEVVVEDWRSTLRCLFDIHDGTISHVEGTTAVPWVSIAGSPRAWAAALAPEKELSGLQLTGEQVLGRRLLAALPRWQVEPLAGEEPAALA